jgi:ribonuclease BN (tRNA processing enzyme)
MTSPKIKLTFLGSGSAFTIGEGNYHSNVLLEDIASGQTLLIDCGSDVRFSLFELGMGVKNIDSVYISHIHADHTGGLEWLGFSRYFGPFKLSKLYLHERILVPLWETLRAGMATLDDQPSTLATFFDVHPIRDKGHFEWCGHRFRLEKNEHVVNNGENLPCYGLQFSVNEKTIYFTADSRFLYSEKKALFEQSTIIFHDCETAKFKSGVHTHYTELLTMPEAIRNKVWLYHYNPGDKPDPEKDGFKGFVKKGQQFLL